jgi:acetyl-CoA carboxylase carboxyl transferase subunit beta
VVQQSVVEGAMTTSLGLPRVGSAAVVIDDQNRVLLGQRKKEPNFGRWVLPGGKVEPFESVEHAVRRELAEETGLTVEVTGQLGVFEIINPPTEHRLIVYSWARAIDGSLRPDSDLLDLKFVGQDEFGSLDVTEIVIRVLSYAGWLPQAAPSRNWRSLASIELHR